MSERILIVDDEQHIVRVFKLYLERNGFIVESVGNGKLAMEWLAQNEPDAVITDIQMPIMDGKELCEKLEEEMPDRKFPIFVMTSMTDREHRTWTDKIKNLLFLEKPVSIRELSRKLDEYFAQT